MILINFFRSPIAKMVIGLCHRLSIYIAPFLLCVLAILHGILYITGYRGEFLYICGEITGHSIFAIYLLRIFTRKMCKWYKRSCNTLLIYHLFNIVAYKLIFKYGTDIIDPIIITYSTLIFCTAALILWFISDSINRVRKAINQAYRHAQIRKRD